MTGVKRGRRVRYRHPEGGRTCLWVRVLTGGRVALVDATAPMSPCSNRSKSAGCAVHCAPP